MMIPLMIRVPLNASDACVLVILSTADPLAIVACPQANDA